MLQSETQINRRWSSYSMGRVVFRIQPLTLAAPCVPPMFYHIFTSSVIYY